MSYAIGRLLRTMRHLRASQVGSRLAHLARLRVNRCLPAVRAWADGEASFASAQEGPALSFVPQAMREVAGCWEKGFVEYLAVRGSREDWSGEGRSKLWRYERQYHSELVALAVLDAGEPDHGWNNYAWELARSWQESCPKPHGDAWEPYPVARRILNWALAGHVSPPLQARLAPGLAAQLRYLVRHLEYHLLGNHLICDAAAIVAGSAALHASGLERLGSRGVALLARELDRQVLQDGGYAERTAQYHALVLRDVLLAIAFSRRRGFKVDVRIEQAAGRMAVWLASVARRDAVPYLNDAAPDAAPPVSEVLSLARALDLVSGSWDGWLGRTFGLTAKSPNTTALGRGDSELRDTGWSLVREEDHELLFEHGPIGPDEQPGHGHSDALSFELFWDGHPIVTDTGVTTYDIGPVRDFERSAPAHATVSVGGVGPDELWAAFRVGARGRVEGGTVTRTPEGVRVLAGRVRAPAGWEHRRRIVYWPGEAVVVLDRVLDARAPVHSHLPLDPSCELDDGVIRHPGGTLSLQVVRGRQYEIRSDAWVGEGFGRRRLRTSVTFAADANGLVGYALLAPDRSVVIEDGRCVIRGPLGVVCVDTTGLA